ncbi:LysR family transcriptional regulator [Candidatus Phycosocius spiralis]|uniref:HTH lysR-type domain-containing protein n=1 Tax=Candidatus Phycosocius spiralis TaxID=2815099 RepID=A0ABQ4PXC0_9PROT|nr:LysR family transcriptional regulator [Candidatus Phycosocius spiralis]GIU67672.1 hypothetical protein PsB1_1826 [Candidatus Phycosocius spiralis]
MRHKSIMSDLHVFHDADLCRGPNVTAHALRVHPSTVSRALDQLEADLNARRVRRTAQGSVLTNAGILAHTYRRTIDYHNGELDRDICDSAAVSPNGAVTLFCSDEVAVQVICPALTHLLRENPKLDIHLVSGFKPNRPLESDAEISPNFSAEPISGYCSHCLAFFHHGLFESRSLFELYGMPASLEDALCHTCLNHEAQTHTEAMKRQFPPFQTLARRRVETNSSAAFVEGVLAGIRIAWLQIALVPMYPELVMVGSPATAIELSMVYHRDLERIPRIQAIICWLESIFDQRTKPWFLSEFIWPSDLPTHPIELAGDMLNGTGEFAKTVPPKLRVLLYTINQSGV